MKKILCPYCRIVLESHHYVVLDINYTIWHESCYYNEGCFQKKDKGPFIDIIEKYSVFHEILPNS